MARPDVCVVGEVNPDLILYGLPQELKPEQEILIERFQLTLGSSSAIFAHNLAALGTSVGIVSKVGADPLGQLAKERLSEGGVEITHVGVSATETSTGLTVILPYSDHRFILTYPGTMFDLTYEDLNLDYIMSARHLHLSSFFLHRLLRPRIAELFRRAKAMGLTTSLDTNDDPEGRWGDDLLEVLAFVDILLPNEREAKRIARRENLDEALAALSQLCPTLVVKLGVEGAVARQGGSEWRCPALAVNPVDTVGAGDSFDAGYVHRFLAGANPQECLRYANAVGAFSTTKEGGTEAFRDRDALARFLRDMPR